MTNLRKLKKKITVVVPLGYQRELAVVESLEKQKDNLDFFIEVGPNPPANRNHGVDKAKTELIGFVNAHSLLTDHWSEEVLRFFSEHPEIDIVGGPQLTAGEENFFARTSGYALSSPFGTADLTKRYKIGDLNLHATEKDITLANLVCRRRVLEKIRFDETLYPGEDVKFIHDAEKEGFSIAYSPDICVYNKRRKQFQGFYGFMRQIFNYGRVRPRVEGWGKLLKKPLFFFPSFFVLYILALPLLLLAHSFFVFPLLLYWALNLFFSLFASIKHRSFFAFFLLPLLFFVIHVTYGLGFINGAARGSSLLKK